MDKKLIICDFSGTLAEEPTKNIPSLLEGLREMGLALDAKNQQSFLDLLKRSLSDCFDWYSLSQRVATFFRKELDGEIIELLKKNIVFVPFPDVRKIAVLPMKKAILTDASPFLVGLGRFQKNFGIFAPQITGCRKPDSEAFQYVLDHYDVRAEESVMIGNDLDEDLKPALKMGMTPFLIDRKGKTPKELVPAGIVKISSLDEVAKYLSYI